MNNSGADLAPLILTALLPKDLHSWATNLRDCHFPADRNFLEAHVTLFHALPPQYEAEIAALCKRIAGELGSIDAELRGVMPLGKGTALKLESEPLLALREDIAEHFHGLLTGQDQHSPRLHITIQNKVTIEAAKALQAELADFVEPRLFQFRGLGLYRYRGGPWEKVSEYVFRGQGRGF